MRDSTRLLIFVPECHETPRYDAAAHFARELSNQQPECRVRLFLEGLCPESLSKVPSGLRYPADAAGSEIALKVYAPLAFVNSALRMCLVSAAFCNRQFPERDDILSRASALVAKSQGRDPAMRLAIDELQRWFIDDVLWSGEQASHFVALNQEVVIRGLRELPCQEIPAGLRPVLCEALQALGSDDVRAFNVLICEAAKFFDEHPVELQKQTLGLCRNQIAQGNILGADRMAQSFKQAAALGRELIMAYFVAREQFDCAVFNCGRGHAESQNLRMWLARLGIRCAVWN